MKTIEYFWLIVGRERDEGGRGGLGYCKLEMREMYEIFTDGCWVVIERLL